MTSIGSGHTHFQLFLEFAASIYLSIFIPACIISLFSLITSSINNLALFVQLFPASLNTPAVTFAFSGHYQPLVFAATTQSFPNVAAYSTMV